MDPSEPEGPFLPEHGRISVPVGVIGVQVAAELLETADLRLENPEASLKELGLMHNPPIGKSGVNHRLRKLSNLAETLRGSKEEHYYD